MPNVVFVAPYLLDATLRFVAAAADLDGARVGLVTAEPLDRVPEGVRRRLAAFQRVASPLDPDTLVRATGEIARGLGPVDRLVGALEQLQVPLAEARARLGLPGMDVDTARNFRDKDRMKRVLRGAGIPVARHCLASDAEAARSFCREVGFPVVAKPPEGAGAKSTFRIDTRDRLESCLDFARPRPGAPLLLEEFLHGREHSFDSVLVDGEPRWFSVSDYHPTPLEVLENDWIQWAVHLPREVDGDEYREVRRIAGDAIRALGLRTGLTHMEWFRRPDGSVAVSEIAARPPGAQFMTLLSFAHDADLYRAWAELQVFDRWPALDRNWSVGAAYLRGMGHGRVEGVRGLDEAQRELGHLVVEAKLPEPGRLSGGGYEGEGHVILRDRDSGTVLRGLARTVQLVRVEVRA